MLHIDPELKNPKVDNKFLMYGNRINPEIGIAGEDIIEGAGIEIERLDNGKIKVSLVEDDEESDSNCASEYFSSAIEIDLFSILPTKNNIYHFVLPSGIDYENYNRTGFDRAPLKIERENLISDSKFVFDENGNSITEPEVNTLTVPVVSFVFNGNYVNFTFTSDVVNKLFMFQLYKSGNLVYEVYTINSSLSVDFSAEGFGSGSYNYSVRVYDRITLEQSPLSAAYFNFSWGVWCLRI